MERTRFMSHEQYLDTGTNASTPLPSGFNQHMQSQSPVDLFTRNVEDDAERMGQAWKRTVRQQFEVAEGYRSVAALLVRWNDDYDRDLQCAKEVDELHDLLLKEYHYSSRVLELDTHTRPQQQLNCAIAELVRHHDGPHDTHLLIVYYSGHGIGRAAGELELAAVPNNDDPKVPLHEPKLSWPKAERDLDDATADVLIALDCCAAGNILKKGILGNGAVQVEAQAALVARSTQSCPTGSGGRLIATQCLDVLNERFRSTETTISSSARSKAHEVLAACGGRQKAEKPGDQSFTRHFIDILRDESRKRDGPPMNTFELNSKITRRRPDVKSSPQLHQRHAHMRHHRSIQLAPLNPPNRELLAHSDASSSVIKRSGNAACFELSVSLGSRTTLTDGEVEHLACEVSKAAKRAQPNIVSIEWNGFQLAPHVVRFQRTLWRLTITVYYIRRWKRMVRKKQKRKASDILDEQDTHPAKRHAASTCELYLSADAANMPLP